MMDTRTQVQEAQRTPRSMITKKFPPRHIIFKQQKTRGNLEGSQRNKDTYREIKIRTTSISLHKPCKQERIE